MGKHRPYNNYYQNNKPAEPVTVTAPEEEDVVAQAAPTVEPEVVKPVMAVVCDCQMLNVREKPSKTSTVVGLINCGDEVEVDKEKSTEDFYKVCTSTGVEGFCMKQFISIKQ